MSQKPDYSYNPYDFANPIAQESLFSGREEELKTIRYYLDEAKKAPRPVNLALLGPRASGKTSLLNMIDLEAHKRGFCVVRVDLNEADVSSAASFFFKVFDSVLNAVFDMSDDADNSKYPFGGVAGKVFETYLDLTSTYTTDIDKQWCPFLFPLQYAKAQAASVDLKRALISDHLLKRDLQLLSKEISRTICILFDESDCLTKSVELLEMVRNIFMNISGYMLVFAGLPTLFPMMSDVFSPIIRQFKRIEVRAFENRDDTRDCIQNPLESIGIRPREIIDLETQYDVHELAGGRPYEINLICHFLFRRVQEGKAPRMLLNEGVIEDVRHEFEQEQDISAKPVLAAIRNLDLTLLRKLSFFSKCLGRAKFDDLWIIDHVIQEEQEWSKEDLQQALKRFVHDQILLVEESGIIKFAGDDFDRIYTKYYARNKSVNLSFSDFPLELYAAIRLKNLVSVGDDIVLFPEYPFVVSLDVELANIAASMGESGTADDVYVKDPPYLFDLFRLATECQMERQLELLKVAFKTPNFTVELYFRSTQPQHSTVIFKEVTGRLKDATMRGLSIDSQLTAVPVKIDFPDVEDILRAIRSTANSSFREEATRYHVDAMVLNYMDRDNMECALHHANIAREIGEVKEVSQLNNVGYLFMRVRDLQIAEEYFARALEKMDTGIQSLVLYNIVVLQLLKENHAGAFTSFEQLQDYIAKSEKPQGRAACLLVPSSRPGGTEFEERKDISIEEATALLQAFFKEE